MNQLVVIGSVNVDLHCAVARHPVPGETLLGTHSRRRPGGKGANQALAAAVEGVSVKFVGAVGDDVDAVLPLNALRSVGVNLDGVAIVSGTPTGLAIVTVSQNGENTIVVIPGANAAVTPETAMSAVASMARGDVLLMQGELPRETTTAAIRVAGSQKHRVVFNAAPWIALPPDALTQSDPLVVNEHEAAQAVQSLDLQTSGSEPNSLAKALVSAGIRSVVVTLGARGAIVATRDAIHHEPSPKVKSLDTTGAGDAFTGALAARLLQGEPLTSAVRHAVRVGAMSVQYEGAQINGQPTHPAKDGSAN